MRVDPRTGDVPTVDRIAEAVEVVEVQVTHEQLRAILRLESACWSIGPDAVAVFDGKRWEPGFRAILGDEVVERHKGKAVRLVTPGSGENAEFFRRMAMVANDLKTLRDRLLEGTVKP